jgi:predicted dehydrogenase
MQWYGRRMVSPSPVRLGFIGCGNVSRHYAREVTALIGTGRAEVTAAFDPDRGAAAALADRFTGCRLLPSADAVIESGEVDGVLVLAPMAHHATLTCTALAAGASVLVEKPIGTTLAEGRQVLEAASDAPGVLVCAPNVALSPTFIAMRAAIAAGALGRIHLARARYGHSGPTWGPWYYQRGGGTIFDLAVYNLTSLTAFLGSVRRVLAFAGTAIPERIIDGEAVDVEVIDNAQILLDFGDATYASVTSGFTIAAHRGPAIELYGDRGTIQLLGEDWAPEGYEIFSTEAGSWERFPAPESAWHWAGGIAHLVDCIRGDAQPALTVDHAYHVLEIMIAIERSAAEGRAIDVESVFSPQTSAADRVP